MKLNSIVKDSFLLIHNQNLQGLLQKAFLFLMKPRKKKLIWVIKAN